MKKKPLITGRENYNSGPISLQTGIQQKFTQFVASFTVKVLSLTDLKLEIWAFSDRRPRVFRKEKERKAKRVRTGEGEREKSEEKFGISKELFLLN